MPIQAGLDSTTNVFRTTISGTVTVADVTQHLAIVRQVGAYQYPGLIDARGAHTVTFGTRELMKIAHHARYLLETTEPAPRAVVVDGLVHFGMARLFASLVAGWVRVGVFDDAEHAEAWLVDQKKMN